MIALIRIQIHDIISMKISTIIFFLHLLYFTHLVILSDTEFYTEFNGIQCDTFNSRAHTHNIHTNTFYIK